MKNQPVIFLHILKAGGTTLWKPLCREYKVDEIYKCTEYNILRNFKNAIHFEQKVDELKTKSKIKLFGGHFPFGLHKSLDTPVKYFTMFRSPIERIISDYNHIINDSNHIFYNEVVNNSLSFHDYLTSGKYPLVDNGQVRFLCGEKNIKFGQVSEHHLTEAKRNLIESFQAWGILEYFNESMIHLTQEMNWSLPFYKKYNVGSYREDVISSKCHKLLDNLTKYDLQLYDFAKDIFLQKYASNDNSYNKKFKILKLVNAFYSKSIDSSFDILSNKEEGDFVKHIYHYNNYVFNKINGGFDESIYENINNMPSAEEISLVMMYLTMKNLSKDGRQNDKVIIEDFLTNNFKSSVNLDRFATSKIKQLNNEYLEALEKLTCSRWQEEYQNGYHNSMGNHKNYFYNKNIIDIGLYQQIESGKRIVEFAPGDGKFIEESIKNYPNKNFYLIDISKQNIESLTRQFESYANVQILLNYPQVNSIDNIDIIFSFLLSQSMPKTIWIEHLKITQKMLNKGGSYIFQFAYHENMKATDSLESAIWGGNTYSVEEIAKLLEETGFSGCDITIPIYLNHFNSDAIWYLCRAFN